MSPTARLTEYLTPEDRAVAGRQARSRLKRSDHAEWSPDATPRDPLGILERQAVAREQSLLPIRYGRMAASPFAFFRGAAAVMAGDLAAAADTGLVVQLCGDAHLANFGGFASPERDLVFDVNDFDETTRGPFEWDLKRLVASVEIAARSRGCSDGQRATIIGQAARQYRQAMSEFAGMHNLDIWYAKLDGEGIKARWGAEVGAGVLENLSRVAAKAETKDRLKASAKLTHSVDGELRFLSDPPLLVPVEELFSDAEAWKVEDAVRTSLRAYRRTLQGDRRHLLETYRYSHLARKVVGVGSVGTRCWVALFVGRDTGDPLFLQVKEADASVLEPFVGKSRFTNHGQRVVEGQRLMQAASDVLLGWHRAVGPDGSSRDFYMRQLWDWKASADVDGMPPKVLGIYGEMCAWTLARAHARSGDAIAIAAYLGSGDAIDRSLTRFAGTYADQNQRDHRALVDAITAGTVAADPVH
ncbi:MAG: DUF2252 domain-containing protein [Acidimicrobiales bacterium]